MAKAFDLTLHSPKKVVSSKLGEDEKSNKAKANKQEKSLAKKLDGVRQPMSGALPGYKGDVKLEHFLLDSKQTAKGTLLITRKDLVKINREAVGEDKEPGLVIMFEKIARGTPDEWVVIPLDVFAKMIQNNQDEVLKCR